ncbi:MAG TPA: hypothetical protein DCX45_03500 [Acinetobacter junii]|nr:hypothetical protein [Acinetobacter junii]
MKRFIIEKNPKGVAIKDKFTGKYIIDASLIEDDFSFTIAKKEVIRKRVCRWETKITYSIKNKK